MGLDFYFPKFSRFDPIPTLSFYIFLKWSDPIGPKYVEKGIIEFFFDVVGIIPSNAILAD